MPTKPTAVIFNNCKLAPGETKTFCADAPEGKYTPLRLLILKTRYVKFVSLSVSDQIVLKDVPMSTKDDEFSVWLQTEKKYSVVSGCVFELTLTNEATVELGVLAGITGTEETA